MPRYAIAIIGNKTIRITPTTTAATIMGLLDLRGLSSIFSFKSGVPSDFSFKSGVPPDFSCFSFKSGVPSDFSFKSGVPPDFSCFSFKSGVPSDFSFNSGIKCHLLTCVRSFGLFMGPCI